MEVKQMNEFKVFKLNNEQIDLFIETLIICTWKIYFE